MTRWTDEAIPLAAFLLAGAVWIWGLRLVPEGALQDALTGIFAVAFGGAFLVLIGRRVRRALHPGRATWRDGLLALTDLALLLLGYALVHERIGLRDTTRPDSPVVHEFANSLYCSVVTFTTLGYGDFVPVGVGRAVACIESLVGFLVLGLLASTSATVLLRAAEAKAEDEQDERPRRAAEERERSERPAEAGARS